MTSRMQSQSHSFLSLEFIHHNYSLFIEGKLALSCLAMENEFSFGEKTSVVSGLDVLLGMPTDLCNRSDSWSFLCYFQILDYVHNAESGINTENSNHCITSTSQNCSWTCRQNFHKLFASFTLQHEYMRHENNL